MSSNPSIAKKEEERRKEGRKERKQVVDNINKMNH
jgi:hypothetical protein